jgi:hypothetical protein
LNGNGTVAGDIQIDDPRMAVLALKVVGPWANLEEWWRGSSAALQAKAHVKESAERSSAFILLDFANFLNDNIQPVLDGITDPPKAGNLTGPAQDLYNALGASLRQAIAAAKQSEIAIEASNLQVAWPPAGYTPYPLMLPPNDIDPLTLQDPVRKALPPLSTLNQPPPALPPPPKKPSNAQGSFYFIVRCVYQRPQCRKLAPPLISEPSQPFQMASFFDADAPARRTQIAMPVDTSPRALSKYDKGVAFVISDELRNQMKRIQGLKELTEGDIGGPGFDLGMICSFSIPIITICALILLLLIVIILNLVFFWIPFFKICFPVPELKGK